jgi:hypothetical protein
MFLLPSILETSVILNKDILSKVIPHKAILNRAMVAHRDTTLKLEDTTRNRVMVVDMEVGMEVGMEVMDNSHEEEVVLEVLDSV